MSKRRLGSLVSAGTIGAFIIAASLSHGGPASAFSAPAAAVPIVNTSSVGRIGAGAARLSVLSDGTGRLYVNAKGLTPGRWNEHLWTGTCSSLGSRVAVLPGLTVPASGAVARTNVLSAAQARGRTLRLVSGSVALCTSFGAASQGPAGPTGPTETATVVRVVDGDTIVVDRGRGEEHIRYIGVDTPETVHPSKPVEAFGREASAANRALVEGRQVVLERDISEVDRYGRLLRYVWLADGSSWSFVNLELVKRGYAQVVTYPPDVKYVDQFLAAQREARAAGRGLWGVTPDTSPSPSPNASPVASPRGCDPAYPSVCIPPPPPDLDCGDIPDRRFAVLPPDPHRFDGNHDGVGCES